MIGIHQQNDLLLRERWLHYHVTNHEIPFLDCYSYSGCDFGICVSLSNKFPLNNEDERIGNPGVASTEKTEEQRVQQTDETDETDVPSLHELFAKDFGIGAAIEPGQITGRSAELFKKHVNWLVAENAMKMDAIQPAEGQFQWANADRIVEFAKKNNMQVRFHTLVWHNQVGDWFFKDADGKPMVEETDPKRQEANRRLLLKRLDTHVRTVVSRYKDDISSWDVVNEVIEPGDPDGMRNSDWYKITGTDYIATAFRAAREAGGRISNCILTIMAPITR